MAISSLPHTMAFGGGLPATIARTASQPPASVNPPVADGDCGTGRPAWLIASQNPANRSCESGDCSGPPRNAMLA